MPIVSEMSQNPNAYKNFCLNRNTHINSKNTKIWSWGKISENQIKKEEEKVPKWETLDELIALLLEVRVDLTMLNKSVNDERIKEELKWDINGIDIDGCGFSQNISKKLKDK